MESRLKLEEKQITLLQAVASFGLSLPLLLGLLAFFGFEPDLASLEQWTGIRESALGSLLFGAAFLLLAAGFGISMWTITRRSVRERRGAAGWLVVCLAGFQLIVILGISGAIIVDQYPCWVGVLNCD